MKSFIEKYPEIAAIFYKHARNDGNYIPDYKYEEVAKELTELFKGKIKVNQVMSEIVKIDTSKLTRLTVVDNKDGRIVEKWNNKIKLSIQDNGRTLKVFLEENL
jgi:hypothetical protein